MEKNILVENYSELLWWHKVYATLYRYPAQCKRGYLQVIIEWFKDFIVVYFIHFKSNIKKKLVDNGDPI